ncbi:tyrosine-protein phosphatase [Dubosiella newyorkensis]|uniref:tyrosine-protein phosphatase n=1 Tax=Dubosiella newyorkensis TaxID=1862672 RepID=UPI0023EFFA35|nr:CpsB/CapC family capsule biosynthesis tyrosine phosphatase [Dubosiella newyorkensis]
MIKKIDLHSHIAWGIDDGMPDVPSARQALQCAREDGIIAICSTPHFVSNQLDSKQIQRMRDRQIELAFLAEKYGIEIYAGAEMFMDESFVRALNNGLYQTINRSRYLLCEFDVRQEIHSIPDASDRLYEVEIRGMKPVIAHVERYFHHGLDEEMIREWKENGYIFQINRTSLQGMHGKTIQANAWWLIEHGYGHIICTDTHRAEGHRVEKLSDIETELIEKVGIENAKKLLYSNPLRILLNKPIEQIEVHIEKKGIFRRQSWLEKSTNSI